MLSHSPRLLTAALLFLLFLLLLAPGCGGDPGDTSNGPPTGGISDVETVAVDGFVVLVDHQSVQLFDPSTGKFSEFYFTDGGDSDPGKKVAISPDGAHIAWVNQAGVLIGEVILFEGGPAVGLVHQLNNADLGDDPTNWVRWSYDGTRVFYNSGAIDPVSGAIFHCDFGDNTAGLSVPGGHTFVCGSDPQLFTDDVALAQNVSPLLSADGQLAGVNTHIPTGTQLVNTDPFYAEDLGEPTLTGDFARFPGASDGDYVVAEAAGAGGFVTVYRVEQADYVPPVVTSFDPGVAFTTGQSVSRTSWPLGDVFLPYFTDGAGRAARFRALSADGSKAYYAVNSWIIERDEIGNSFYETPVEAALVEINQNGDSRGFRGAALGFKSLGPNRDEALTGRLGRAVDLGDDDVLVALFSGFPGAGSWVGWLDGEPWTARDIGVMSTDGRWFAGTRAAEVDAPAAICLSEVKRGAKTLCIPRENYQTYAFGWAGYGLKDEHASDAPKVLSLSQTAAYDGAQVTVFGVRFGTSGTLAVGGLPVPASAIVSWEDRRIVFRMAASLPEAGAVVVEAATGSSEGGRRYWLHRTDRITTPFDALVQGEITLGQGLNVVDLGDLDITSTRDIHFNPDTRLDDGQYVVFSDGGPQEPETRRSVKLEIDGYSNALSFRTEDRLADPALWQLVNRLDRAGANPGSAFVHIAGALVNVLYAGALPYASDGGRVVLGNPSSPIPGTASHNWGIPAFWRERPDGESAWVRLKVNNYSAMMLLQTGWSFEGNQGAIPLHADQPRTLMNHLEGVEGAGSTVVATGADPLGEGGAAFALSSDGGVTFAPHTAVGPTLGRTDTRLREPIRVEADAGTFFLVMESPNNAPGLDGVHAIQLDGTFIPNIAEVPPGNLGGGLSLSKLNLQYAVKGGEVLLYFPPAATLVRADFDAAAPASGQYAWETLPGSDLAGRVVSFYNEPGTDEVIVVLDDGAVLHADADWTTWTPLTFDVDLALPTVVQPTAVSRLPDGRWLISAKLFDARPGVAAGTHSPLGTQGLLVSPAR